MSWFLLRNFKLPEPYEGKLSRTVLRGESGSNPADLPDKAIAKEGMADYIKYLFKTVRKYLGEAIVVTQEVEDIISSPVVKQAIINNSDCKILLDQSKYQNKFGQIQELLGLTEKEKTLILSVNKANDPLRKYKEVFISLGGTLSRVYRTEVSLEEYLCYTTEESEKIKVIDYAARFGSMQKGLRHWQRRSDQHHEKEHSIFHIGLRTCRDTGQGSRSSESLGGDYQSSD